MEHHFIILRAREVVLALLTISTAVVFAQPVIEIPFHVAKGYNEGWSALHAARVARHLPLYWDRASLVTNDYPPLYFYLLWLFGSMFGDYIIAGRVLSLLGLVIVATNIIIVSRLSGASGITAAFGALLFLGLCGTYSPVYIGMNDPQWLALALTTTGLVVVLTGSEKDGPIIAACALMYVAGLIKHNVIPLPLAVAIWLWFQSRRQFYLWVGFSLLLLLASAWILYVCFGPDVFVSIFQSPRVYSFSDAAEKNYERFLPLLTLISASAVYLVFAHENRHAQLIGIYIGIAALWSAAVSGGNGIDINHTFDLVIGLSIAASMIVHEGTKIFVSLKKFSLLQAALMFALALPVLTSTPRKLTQLKIGLPESFAATAQTAEAVKFLKNHPNRAACETLALCYWADKDFEVDFFNTGQKVRKGAIKDTVLLDLIQGRKFAVIQLNDKSGSGRLPQEINKSILDHYEIKKTLTRVGVLLTPRS